jgi:hypothetical protein
MNRFLRLTLRSISYCVFIGPLCAVLTGTIVAAVAAGLPMPIIVAIPAIPAGFLTALPFCVTAANTGLTKFALVQSTGALLVGLGCSLLEPMQAWILVGAGLGSLLGGLIRVANLGDSRG